MTSKIAKITPLIRLPSQVDVFDYFIPPDLEDKIKVGQIVSVPWRNRYVSGVILGLLDVPSPLQGEGRACPVLNTGVRVFRARPVKKIIDLQPVLTSAQLALIKKFSDYYFVTPGSVARLIIPERPTRLGQARATTMATQSISFQIAKSQLPLIEQAINPLLFKSLSRPRWTSGRGKGEGRRPAVVSRSETKAGGGCDSARVFVETQDISSFVWLIFYLLKKQSRPLLLLLPTINLIDIFLSALKKYQAQMAVIHSGLSLGAYWQAHQKILRGQTRIILSTRQGVFLPIPTNSTIVMFDAASQDFKQYDQHPRYDARLVAQWTANLTKSQLILTNPSPLLGEKSALSPLPLGEGRACPVLDTGVRDALPTAIVQKTAIQLVDMKQNLQSPEFSIVSDEVIEEIQWTQAPGKKTLIIALRQQADKGVSVNKIKDALTKLIKDGKYNVILNGARAERGRSEGSRGLTTRFFAEFTLRSPPATVRAQNDVVISTPHLMESGQLLPYRGQISCLVIASIEPLLAIPDYRAGERAFYRLKHWQMWAQELAIPKIILQSYSPENPAVRAFAYNELEHFVSAELETRKRFDYPPFSQLIKLTYQGKDENEIDRVAKLLSARASGKLIVRGPYQAHKSEKKSILLKIRPRHASRREASDDADLSFLRTLSSAWAIDRDPENVL